MADRDEELQVVRGAEPFDAFYLREYPRMVAVAYALSGSRWAAEELAQEACMRAFRSWDKISRYDKPGAWLRRVTVNLATSHVRRRVSEAKAMALVALRQRQPLDPHPEVERGFWEQLRALPRRQRQVVVLHDIDGLSMPDISEVLDLSESTVRTHLQRGRQTLVRKIQTRGDLS